MGSFIGRDGEIGDVPCVLPNQRVGILAKAIDVMRRVWVKFRRLTQERLINLI